jgi:transcription initiation factor IIF auxiliary subunit
MALGGVAAVGSYRIEERAMTLKISQEATSTAPSHWRWSVWLDAPDKELDTVKDVLWKLHPSFSPPEVQVDDRKSAFRLDSSGWGEFEIQADIHLSNGETVSLRHRLRLSPASQKKTQFNVMRLRTREVAPPDAEETASRQPTVFLSYTSADARLAGALSQQLKREHDVNVVVDVDIPAGEDLNKWLYETITESDAVVFLLPVEEDSSYRDSSYIGLEAGLATSVGARIIPVLRSDSAVPNFLAKTQAIRISGSDSYEMDARNIAQRISDIVV